MKQMNTYILEKLHINKDTKIRNEEDFWNAKTFQKDDILYANPNISRGPKNPGKPGIPTFYKVFSNNGKKLRIIPIQAYLELEENGKHGSVMPNEKTQYKDCNVNIDKDGFAYYGGNVLYLWDGKPVEFYR